MAAAQSRRSLEGHADHTAAGIRIVRKVFAQLFPTVVTVVAVDDHGVECLEFLHRWGHALHVYHGDTREPLCSDEAFSDVLQVVRTIGSKNGYL